MLAVAQRRGSPSGAIGLARGHAPSVPIADVSPACFRGPGELLVIAPNAIACSTHDRPALKSNLAGQPEHRLRSVCVSDGLDGAGAVAPFSLRVPPVITNVPLISIGPSSGPELTTDILIRSVRPHMPRRLSVASAASPFVWTIA